MNRRAADSSGPPSIPDQADRESAELEEHRRRLPENPRSTSRKSLVRLARTRE